MEARVFVDLVMIENTNRGKSESYPISRHTPIEPIYESTLPLMVFYTRAQSRKGKSVLLSVLCINVDKDYSEKMGGCMCYLSIISYLDNLL